MISKIKDIRLTQAQKVMIAVFAAILVLLCISGFIIFINRTRQQSAVTLQTLTVPTSENSPAASDHIFLPAIAADLPTQQVESSPLLEVAPTQTPPNLWRVTEIQAQSYRLRGYVYDLGVFENIRTGETIKAFCANPGWPTPNIGDLYMRNEWNVLLPLNNDEPPWIQHFIVIED
jgi:hypothetical protein